MKLTDLPGGGLTDCDCGEPGRGLTNISVPELAPLAPQITAPAEPVETAAQPVSETIATQPAPKRPRRQRSKGRGSFCVISHKGRVVHCYVDEGKAKRVASAWAKRAGTKFTVRRR